MKKCNLRFLRLALVASYLFALMSASVQAQDSVARTQLDPNKKARVRDVGHVLLQANRTYPRDVEADQIRAQIIQVRQAIELLVQPQSSGSLIVSQRSANTPVSIPSNVWQQTRSAKIQQLNSRLATLHQSTQAFRTKKKPQSTGFFQRIRGWFASDSDALSKKHSVLSSASEYSLGRLDNLDTDIAEALTLNPVERYQKLNALAESLRFHQRNLRLSEDEKADTPTYITRTTHR